MSSQSAEGRTRQACEPCRRKKTKCTGERPICSFCRRLSLQCSYLPRERPKSSGVVKSGKKATTDRFRRLETQVNDLYGLLNHSSPMSRDRTSLERIPPSGNIEASPSGSSTPTATQRPLQPSRNQSRFSGAEPDPPIEVIEQFAEVYRDVIHLQPLPLLSLDDLPARLLRAPQYLLRSFLALALTLSSHDFYKGVESIASDFYARSAETAAMKLAAEGIAKLEVTQCLCLIALRHIKVQQLTRAWMVIGTASRLEALRSLSYAEIPSASNDAACKTTYWSAFILERLLSSQATALSDTDIPAYPESAPLPPTPSVCSYDSEAPDFVVSEDVVKDLGVLAYSLKMVSVWGDLRSYLHRIRAGHLERPWAPDSTHTKLTNELLQTDAITPESHLLRCVAFHKRTAAETLQQREYWNPWLTMQIACHASSAILNHPFLHLVVLRSRDGVPQSRYFLQQTVDMALFHSGWVFRLIQMCEDHLFEIHDPLLGDMVAATATIPWLFQFARDQKVSQRAQDDLRRAEKFLDRMGTTWPHIASKLNVIRNLQALASTQHQDTGRVRTVSFKRSLFWDLLDPRIAQSTQNLESGNRVDADARLNLTTHFAHPLEEREPQTQTLEPTTEPISSLFVGLEDLEQFQLDDLSSNFLQNGMWPSEYDLYM